MTTLNIKFDAATADRFPAYAKYPGQMQPQPAFIELETSDGELTVDYSGEIGNAVPGNIYHGIDLRWDITPEAKSGDISTAIDCLTDLFQQVLDGHSVSWDGKNYVGRLTEEAQEASEKIQRELDAMLSGNEGGLIESLHQWIEQQPFPADGQSVEEFAGDVVASDGESGYWFKKAYTAEEMLSELRDVWAEELYSGNKIPAVVARHLIEQGTCDDSNWMDELRKFATAE